MKFFSQCVPCIHASNISVLVCRFSGVMMFLENYVVLRTDWLFIICSRGYRSVQQIYISLKKQYNKVPIWMVVRTRVLGIYVCGFESVWEMNVCRFQKIICRRGVRNSGIRFVRPNTSNRGGTMPVVLYHQAGTHKKMLLSPLLLEHNA